MNNNNTLTVEYIKKESEPIFKKYNFIDKVYLFGSYARNSALNNSDIDLVVKLNTNVGMKLYGLYDEFENSLNKKIDLLTENEIMNIMPKTYFRDRVLIYEKWYKIIISNNVENNYLKNPYLLYDL